MAAFFIFQFAFRGFVSPLEAALTQCFTSVASKGLTKKLNPLSATITKKGDGVIRPAF